MTKVLAGLVSPEASLLGLQMAMCLLCPHMAFCPGHTPPVSSYMDTSTVGLGPHT